jgi:hypothetical protein
MNEVPLLDLAPKLKRPLSLWNPLDYLLLLYWVFYFPQAISWYVETFCEPLPESDLLTWQQRWELIQNSSRKRQLLIMGLFLVAFISVLFNFVLEKSGIEVNWNNVLIWLFNGSLLNLIIAFSHSFVSGFIVNISLCITFSIASAIWRSIGWSLLSLVWHLISPFEWRDLAATLVYRLTESATLGFGIGIVASIALGGFRGKYVFTVIRFFSSMLSIYILFAPIYFIFDKSIFSALVGLLSTFLIWMISILAVLRLDNIWLSFKHIPRITPLISYKLTYKLRDWLDLDWYSGVVNANQILKYSSQLLAVDFAINDALNHTKPENLLERLTLLYEFIWDFDVPIYTCTSLKKEMISSVVKGILWLPYKSYWIERLTSHNKLDLDTSPRRIASVAFMALNTASREASRKEWNECVNFLSKSIQLFSMLRHIKYGEEMYQLTSIILDFSKARNILALLEITPPQIPEGDVLRFDTWRLIKEIFSALEELRIIVYSTSRSARSFALNRSLGHITESLKPLKALSKNGGRFEVPVALNVIDILQEYLLSVSGSIGKIEINESITNPYIIGDPVLGERFVGRDDILRQLEELWFINTSPQSVILYGHRRMGKTSILRNATTKVNTEVRVAYVNLLSIGSAANGITDILMAICDAITEATDIPAPNNDDLLKFPETTFRRHLQHIDKTFTGKGLIIALDEFEKIEELIEAGKLGKDFLQFLRGMVQMSSKLAFAFAGLHTLQEMNADYFQPFYASFIPISVAFLTREATHQVLANPDPEFLLEYEPEALDYISQLTNGQPYLTQLIGFQLVRLFNDYVFEQGTPRDRTFTIADVRTVCDGENFFNIGIHYFKGVWDQAAEGATGQQEILKALAPYPQGITESALIAQTNLTIDSIQSALNTLKQHDVIHSQVTNDETNGEIQWAIAIELFRIWVAKYKISA